MEGVGGKMAFGVSSTFFLMVFLFRTDSDDLLLLLKGELGDMRFMFFDCDLFLGGVTGIAIGTVMICVCGGASWWYG